MYLAMLFAVATAGAMLAAGSVVWHQEAQRARERELLFIGKEFRNAIGLYYERSPGAIKRYPEKIEDLLRDDRHLSMQRYLRRIYRDPMTGKAGWGFIRAPGGGIMGIYSLSEAKPIKMGGFEEPERDFEGKLRYDDWKFVYVPPPASGAALPLRAAPVRR